MSELTGRRTGSRARRFRALSLMVCLGCAVLTAAGCTTMQPVERQSAPQKIESGDTIRVATRDGREIELAFEDWTSQGLTGTDEAGILQKIGNDDIARVEVQRFSALRSLGVAAVVLGVVVAAAGDSSDFGY